MRNYTIEDIPYHKGFVITDMPEMEPGQSFVYARGIYSDVHSPYIMLHKCISRYKDDYKVSCRKDARRHKKGALRIKTAPTYTVRVYRIEPPKDRV